VLILSGDHVYRADYRRLIDFHLERGAGATVLSSTVPAAAASSFGVLSVDGEQRITGFVEKPADPRPYARDGCCRINLGVYCFDTQVLVRLLVADARRRSSHDFGKDIFPAALAGGGLYACDLERVCPDREPYWRDVGEIDSYFEASMDLLRDAPPFALKDPRWPPQSKFHDWVPARTAAAARLGRRSVQGHNLVANGSEHASADVVNCILSPRVSIGPGCQLEECILFPGAVVGEGARLRRVIVEEEVRVPPGLRLTSGRASASGSCTVSPRGVAVLTSSGDGELAPAKTPRPATVGEAALRG
jgi:glucose-1-phosphate adenylyltransferase